MFGILVPEGRRDRLPSRHLFISLQSTRPTYRSSRNPNICHICPIPEFQAARAAPPRRDDRFLTVIRRLTCQPLPTLHNTPCGIQHEDPRHVYGYGIRSIVLRIVDDLFDFSPSLDGGAKLGLLLKLWSETSSNIYTVPCKDTAHGLSKLLHRPAPPEAWPPNTPFFCETRMRSSCSCSCFSIIRDFHDMHGHTAACLLHARILSSHKPPC